VGLLYHFPERGLKLLGINLENKSTDSTKSPLPLPREGIETLEVAVEPPSTLSLLYHFPERGLKPSLPSPEITRFVSFTTSPRGD
jgi:hypothetical protein